MSEPSVLDQRSLCDECGREYGYCEVRQPRPSDPTDLVCIALSCFTCSSPLTLDQLEQLMRAEPNRARIAEPSIWEEYMHTETAKNLGHMWLT